MAVVAKLTMQCDVCGKRFAWNPSMAGKHVRCPCGQPLAPPADASTSKPTADSLDLYDFIEPAPVAAAPRPAKRTPAFLAPLELDDDGLHCPLCDTAMEPGRVVCSSCKFNFRTGHRPAAASPVAKTVARPPTAAPPPPPRATQSPAPPAAAEALTPYPAHRPARERYSQESAPVPVKRIAAGVLLVVLIAALIAWRVVSGHGPPVLNSGKGSDPEVNELIADDGATEVHAWFAQDPHRLVGEMSPTQATARADELQAMGAKKVLVFGYVMSLAMAVELPDDPAKRTALFAWENRFANEHFYKPDTDVGQHYLLLRLHP